MNFLKTASEIEFIRPYFGWLLLVVLPVCFLNFKRLNQSSPWQKVCDSTLLKYLLVPEKKQKSTFENWLLKIALILSVLALMGPSFHQTEHNILQTQNPLMVVLDMSSSITKTDIKPSRLKRAKIEIADILKKSDVHPSGLIVYSSEPFVVSPLSEDENIIINLLKAIDISIMPSDGQRFDRAVDLALTRLKQSGYLKGKILVVTDSLGEQKENAKQSILDVQKAGYELSVLNVSPFENKELKKLVLKSKGSYANIEDLVNSDFIKGFSKQNFSDLKATQNKMNVLRDDGYWLIFLIALCLLYFFKKGIVFVLIFVVFSIDAQAGFWLNDQYKASKFFNNQEYEKAAGLFKNEAWKASALYKSGDFKKAADLFEKQKDVESQYNYGNALAKSGQIQKAIEVYEAVLKRKPNHEDAKFNLEYLREKLQNQQNNQQNNEDKNQNDNQNQSSSAEQNQNQNDNQAEQNQEKNSEQSEQKDESNAQDNQERKDQSEQNEDGQTNDSGKQVENEEKENQDKEDQDEEQTDQKNKEAAAQQEEQVPLLNAKQGNQSEKYDEEVQALAQQFREIKEDTGGLLREMIKQEYLKNRYGN